MDETRINSSAGEVTDGGDVHVPASEVAGAHESDGTMGRVAGTGSGAISGGIIGAAVAGPVGAVIGAVAGGALGSAAGEAAHHIGDDHDDVNVDTGSEGSLGRISGSSAGGISGAVVGAAAAGPVGAVVGSVAGGMLGAEAGDVAKDVGNDRDATTGTTGGATGGTLTGDPILDSPSSYDATHSGSGSSARTDNTVASDALLPGVPGALAGVPGGGVGPVIPVPGTGADMNTPSMGGQDNPDYNPRLSTDTSDDTPGVMERIADTATGHRVDDNTARRTRAFSRTSPSRKTNNHKPDTNKPDPRPIH